MYSFDRYISNRWMLQQQQQPQSTESTDMQLFENRYYLVENPQAKAGSKSNACV